MNILLDEQAFQEGSANLENIADRMEQLKDAIQTELTKLKNGFQTDAGDKFFAACDGNLLKTMEGQVLILRHVSENLSQAKMSYEPVFESYRDLNRSI